MKLGALFVGEHLRDIDVHQRNGLLDGLLDAEPVCISI